MVIENDMLVDVKSPRIPDKYDIQYGTLIPAIKQVEIFSPLQYEEYINEWIESCLKKEYKKVQRSGGAGDKGRDVVGFVDDSPSMSIWDNYQCKHYENALTPSDIWIELGKLCFYTYKKIYSIPRKYYFVASKGIGPKLMQLIENPKTINEFLKNEWENKCKDKIVKDNSIELDGEFLDYIEQFDFSILNYISPQKVIEDFRNTEYFSFRFGGGLQKMRPEPIKPKEHIEDEEIRYVTELFKAYSEDANEKIEDVIGLKKYDKYNIHFNRQRRNFYCAESLREFSKDILPNLKPFEELQEEIYDGIIDVTEDDFENGFFRLKETIETVKKLVITDNLLISKVSINDRVGICHQMVNKNRIKLVK